MPVMNIKILVRLTLILPAVFAVVVLMASCQPNTSALQNTPPITTQEPVSPFTPITVTTAAVDFYIYPVQPGTPEWSKLNSLDEMIEACQVPQDTLDKMSTQGLVLTVRYYPLWGIISFSNRPQSGFENIAARVNCVQELYTRQDAATELLTNYRDMVLNYRQNTQYALSFTVLETLISQKPIQEKMTAEQHDEFIKLNADKYKT
jgi:hypothetical protein